MAFRISGITNYVNDKKLPASEIAAILARAKKAATAFGEETTFSGAKIDEVLGSQELVDDYLKQREGNLDRYT